MATQTPKPSSSARTIRVLLIEDEERDAFLVLRALRTGGFNVEHEQVWTRDGLLHALGSQPWDIVISDYSMPAFDAPAALAIVRRSAPDLPFIIVSGTAGEDLTVAAMKAGAQDYLMKDKLARLAVSVERELQEAKTRLENRAAQRLAEQALRDKQEAEAASFAKSRLLANVSHELRTPLNAIIGFSELLVSGVPGPLLSRQVEYVRYVLTSGHHLLNLINDLLDFSKMEAGKLELTLERTALEDVAANVCEIVQPLARERRVSLIVELAPGLPKVMAEPLRLRQMLYNLLSNAIKFTQPDGSVTLHGRVHEKQLEIAVTDTGCGIRKEDLPHLFQEFEQIAATPESKTLGTGLGLALTKRLVELHGGSISVHSEPGRGSTFTVCFPVPEGGAAAGDEASVSGPVAAL